MWDIRPDTANHPVFQPAIPFVAGPNGRVSVRQRVLDMLERKGNLRDGTGMQGASSESNIEEKRTFWPISRPSEPEMEACLKKERPGDLRRMQGIPDPPLRMAYSKRLKARELHPYLPQKMQRVVQGCPHDFHLA